ncbi:MAG: hypothetical protein HYV77_03210 [Candidatus Wildermuthbacteria bacterium]|nr:hypothetical protein [Candidatus Wildermuthbacteria bacterium]
MANIEAQRKKIQQYLPAVFILLVFVAIAFLLSSKEKQAELQVILPSFSFPKVVIDFKTLEAMNGFVIPADPIAAPQPGEYGKDNPFAP